MDHVKGRIFIFDLHNTLYDEVTEYGLSMQVALDYLRSELARQDIGISEDDLCQQIADGHNALGSDWDDDVWDGLNCLQNLENRDHHINTAKALRLAKSEELTKSGAYDDTIKVLHDLKAQGARLFLATEATANSAAHAVRWLGLDGVIDAVYSWPFAKEYKKLAKTLHRDFPCDPKAEGVALQKPHPFILAHILFDVARDDGLFPQEVTFDDVMDVEQRDIEGFEQLKTVWGAGMSAQAQAAMTALSAQLCFKDTPYKWALKPYFENSYYIGDSYFKDGFLAQSANIPFIHAAYGKHVYDRKLYDRACQIMYKVTGWEPFLLKLTQEAGRLPALTDQVSPDFICKESFREFWESQRQSGLRKSS